MWKGTNSNIVTTRYHIQCFSFNRENLFYHCPTQWYIFLLIEIQAGQNVIVYSQNILIQAEYLTIESSQCGPFYILNVNLRLK